MVFKKIECRDKIAEVIQIAFSSDLPIEGCWGYTKDESTNISKINLNEKIQTQFTLATMRAYLEMNMTLEKDERYGAINLNELSRYSVEDGYEKVIYEISAIKESEYKAFIDEYKANSEDKDFDMGKHFQRRKEATLKREVTHWFKIV